MNKNLGAAGTNREWHHIVEQNQIDKSGFDATRIHNTNNIISIDAQTHRQISGHYTSKAYPCTNGLSVRDWLAGKSFEFQYQYGIQKLKDFGVI